MAEKIACMIEGQNGRRDLHQGLRRKYGEIEPSGSRPRDAIFMQERVISLRRQ